MKVNLELTRAQNTVGAGVDTLLNIEGLTGSDFADTITIGSAASIIHGGAGDDRIIALNANVDTWLAGDAGNDRFVVGDSPTRVDGGAGYDTVDFSRASGGVDQGYEGALDGLSSIEQIIGSAYADNLGASAGQTVVGGGGNDTLFAAEGKVALKGGTGNDTYIVWGPGHLEMSVTGYYTSTGANASIVEAANEGTDLVQSEISFALPDNVENLQLIGAAAVNGTGNELANVLTGNDQANKLSGGDGDDKLFGNAGDDSLNGGTGNDRMSGGTGNDTYLCRQLFRPRDRECR